MPHPVRLLVVEDHTIVRHTICVLLAEEPTVDVICQTASGEEAVIKAKELQPDLVLMDISLPGISGIEAARQIREVSSKTRIIFLTQHNSIQMAKEAFKVGGHGYVSKIDAAVDLLKAIQAVCRGARFVSRSLISQGWVTESL